MRFRLLVPAGLAIAMVAALLGGPVATREDPPEDQDASDLDPAEAQRLWVKYCTPTPHHRRLEAFVGDWEATTRAWWRGTEKEPVVNRATIHSEMVFGGRFLKTRLTSTMKVVVRGELQEIPVEGLGYIGYNTFAKKYQQIWIDSNNTQVYVSEGTADADGRAIRYFGTMDEWMRGERDMPYMGIDRLVDADTIVSEIHDMTLPFGQTKVMEVDACRAGSKSAHAMLGAADAALQDAAAACPMSELDPEDAMRLWQKYATPTKEHDLLDAFAGDWKVTTRAWWHGPDRDPVVSGARLHSQLIFGGRFLQTEFSSTMKIEVDGQEREVPVQGVGLVGYDTFTKKYTQIWIDSNTTQIYVSEGTADADGRTFRYYGTMDEWMTGEHDKPYMYVDRVVGENSIISEIRDLALSCEKNLVMEMQARRDLMIAKPP